jgi:membrane protein implicated in regulation of membrane protease activity
MSEFLQWHYVIFLAPFGVAAILLVFTLIQGLDDDGGEDADADAGGDGEADAGLDTDANDSGLDVIGDDAGDDADMDTETVHAGSGHSAVGNSRTESMGPLVGREQEKKRKAGFNPLRLLGVGRAPLLFVVETLFIFWGICGFFANKILLKSPMPSLAEMLPSLAIGVVGGIAGSRLSSEVFAKLLPDTETRVRSRHALIGMTGKITFDVTAESGRIRIYDEHGTIHEHSCRPAPGYERIAKGSRALVVDQDPKTNRLIVEETSGQ